MRQHAGGLDDPAELDLAPDAAGPTGAQGPAELVRGLLQGAVGPAGLGELLAERGLGGRALAVELRHSRGHLLQAHP